MWRQPQNVTQLMWAAPMPKAVSGLTHTHGR
jgi:hypothetical protein